MNLHDHGKNSQEFFDPVDFIHDGPSQDLAPSSQFPYLYNEAGRGIQLLQPQGTLIPIEPVNPDFRRGTRFTDITWTEKTIEPDSGQSYTITEFNFRAKAEEVRYEALIASPDNARAFGMTLLQSGQCVEFRYDNLVMADYSYGKWAAYESPYLGKGRGRELLTINPTDLEFHNFPHVFFSRDELPLVITVARWRPYVAEIALADLWVWPGDALVLPPKKFPPPPQAGEDPRKIVLDLHGNRNSALACRLADGKPMLHTTTILANSKAMVDPNTKPHYHEEKTATFHPFDPHKGS